MSLWLSSSSFKTILGLALTVNLELKQLQETELELKEVEFWNDVIGWEAGYSPDGRQSITESHTDKPDKQPSILTLAAKVN